MSQAQVFRNRGPEPIAVYGAELAVYLPGDIIPDATVAAHDTESLAWSSLAGYMRRGLIRREDLELPKTVAPDEVADIVGAVVAAAEARAKSARRGRRAQGEGADPDVDDAARNNTLLPAETGE